MSDESVDSQPEESEEEFRPSAVEVAEPPEPEPANGNGHKKEEPFMEKIVRTSMIPRSRSQIDPDYKAPAPRVSKAEVASRGSRAFLDKLMGEPESTNYRIEIHRFLPSHTEDGKPLQRGRTIHACDVMPMDPLCDEITRAWGGGQYRCVIRDASGQLVPNMEAIVINIPISIYPPKLKKFDGIEVGEPEAAPVAAEAADPADDEIKQKERDLKRQAELDLLEERAAQAEARKTEANLRREIKNRELDKLRMQAANGGDVPNAATAAIAAMQQQMLELEKSRMEQARMDREAAKEAARLEKEAAERRQAAIEAQIKEERDRAERRREEAEKQMREDRIERERIAKEERAEREAARMALERQMKEDRDRAEQQRRDDREAADRRTELMIKMLSDKPKDDSSTQFMLALQQSSERANENSTKLLATLLPAITQKPVDNTNANMMELVKISTESNRQVMEIASRRDQKGDLQAQKYQEQLFGFLMQSVQNPRKDAMGPEMVLKLIGEGRSQTMELIERVQGLQGERGAAEGPDDNGYDANLGFLGNAGKAIFGGLQELVKAASNSPQLMQVVATLLGNRQPTNEQMAAYAFREEQRALAQGNAMPPPVDAPPQLAQQQPWPQQQQQFVMPPPVSGPPPLVNHHQTIITPPPVMNPVTQPPPVTSAPAQQQAPANEQRQATQAEIDVATQMEGEATGVNMEPQQEGQEQTPAVQEQAPPPPVQAPVAQQPQQPDPAKEARDARLRESISETLSEAIQDIEDKLEARDWPENAFAYWNGDFRRALVRAPDDNHRMGLISRYCDPAVWNRLYNLLGANGEELVKFYNGLHALMEMTKQTAQPPVPIPAPVQPQQTQSTPPPVQ